MSRPVRSTLIAGLVLAVLGGLLIDNGDHFGLQLVHLAELGLALGAVLGLVPDRAPAWRAGGFVVGFLAAWFGYALRAGTLPDIPMGRAIATVIVVLIVTLVCTVSGARIPLWSGMLGVAALAGAYESIFSASPTTFTTDSVTAATTVALAVALAFFVATLITELLGHTSEPTDDDVPTPPAQRAGSQASSSNADSGVSIVTTEADAR